MVDDKIDPHIPQTERLVNFSRDFQNIRPKRNFESPDRDFGVRMDIDQLVMMNPAEGDSLLNYNSGSDGALVQVRPPVGFLGGKAQHGHGGDPPVENDPDIRHATVGDVAENGMAVYAILNKGVIIRASEREKPRQNVGDMILELLDGNKLANILSGDRKGTRLNSSH